MKQLGMRLGLWVAAGLIWSSVVTSDCSDKLERGFVHPPASARPWVYWFWLNGNITSNGITADLEAMKRVGIGGVLIMEVDQGAPVGPVDFMSARWRDLFKHVHAESRRLGLEVNMNNDAGWNGSGGPWIKPEQSMQEVVWTETNVIGPQHFAGKLAEPEAKANFYRDIAVQAFPTVGDYRIPNIEVKAAFQKRGSHKPSKGELVPEMIVQRDGITNLTARMDALGKLVWDVPAGRWTIVRFGHTSTGAQNTPSPATGRGLECDKLSKEGIEANFAGMMAKLAMDNGLKPAPGVASRQSAAVSTKLRNDGGALPSRRNGQSGLVATHIDSWENGTQNWTARMREEFLRLRGYDLLLFLPVMTGRVVGSLEISERFLWDLRQTISELVIENYAGRMRELAHAAGMRFTVEAYGSPCDSIPYAGQADEPMGEFWTPNRAMIETCRVMASAAHVYGKRIVGAEAFTSSDTEKWLEHPANIKAIGDRAFCEGINRFVVHRYALQPWAEERRPGMTMGHCGQHYERTQTWWDWTPAWHEYLARCQFLLRQGLFVADICYLQPEAPPQGAGDHKRSGYAWDECTTEAVLTRMSVKDGRIVLPDGMSYRVLVLPQTESMTPALLRKIKELVLAGATVVGPPPTKSPSLAGYPQCDDEVKKLARELWGDGSMEGWKNGTNQPIDRKPDAPLVFPDSSAIRNLLANLGVPRDCEADAVLTYIHRRDGNTDNYFVANPQPYEFAVKCNFRVTGKVPELWWPDSGRIERAAMWEEDDGVTRVVLPFGPSGSVFVVFRDRAGKENHLVSLLRDGQSVLPTLPRLPSNNLPPPVVPPKPAVEIRCDAKGKVYLETREPGEYEFVMASGRTGSVSVKEPAPTLEVSGPWSVRFTPAWGAPPEITLDKLISWSDHSNPGVKYFSGEATYLKTLTVPRNMLAKRKQLYLDLGKVQVMARVKLNGKDLGVWWKPPFRADITSVAEPGDNKLEIQVVNLWPNRMIGDEQLPEDSERSPNGTLKSWPQWLQDGKSSPTGRYTFTSWRPWKKDDALLESGLIGPVRLCSSEVVTLK